METKYPFFVSVVSFFIYDVNNAREILLSLYVKILLAIIR